MIKLLLVALVALFAVVCAEEKSAKLDAVHQYWLDLAKEELQLNKRRFESINPNAKAKNIILFLGDGMGIPTLTAARSLKAQLNGVLPGHPRLVFEEFPFLGLVQTYNTDKLGPDSAGAATAYLCGVKTKLGMIGVDSRVTLGNCQSYLSQPESKIKCVAEIAAEAGKSIGLVTTKTITDGSPAPIYSHTPDRDWESDQEMPADAIAAGCKDIATQLVDLAPYVNVALGGGANFFNPTYRRDKRDLGAEWVAKKSQAGKRPAYVKKGSEFRAVNTATTTDLLGLFSKGNMDYDQERITSGSADPSISEMAIKALEIVQKNPNGYFLFIEGGKIDSAHHNNYGRHALYDTLAFETAISEVLKRVNLNETLVIATADHSHVFSFGSYLSRTNPIFNPSDYEPDSNGKVFTSLLYGNGPGYAIDNDGKRPTLTASETNAIKYRFEAAVPLGSETHGAEDVAIYANGPQAHLISSLVEQSTVAHLMLYSACLGPHADSPHCGSGKNSN